MRGDTVHACVDWGNHETNGFLRYRRQLGFGAKQAESMKAGIKQRAKAHHFGVHIGNESVLLAYRIQYFRGSGVCLFRSDE
ncbi:hypothetical protein [Bordetella sp. FB-8]|uniref:hypothetical protein n=1 Tax=Bordetella sp. FB-8 TaxID=1159870 RepID=UPI00037A0388|nr:hypothetical protein [Bordetella sp. FB-8]